MRRGGKAIVHMLVWGALCAGVVGLAHAWEGETQLFLADARGASDALPADSSVARAFTNQPGEIQGVPSAVPTGVVPTEYASSSEAMTADADNKQYFTLDELKAEMRKLAWTKGDFTIVPYGTLWGSMAYESQRTSPGDYTFYVTSPTTDSGDAFHVDARSSRLGLDLLGPRIACLNGAQTGGKIEVDFQRTIDTENKSGLLLRHAYVDVKNEDFRLLAGQTWDVISPLYPGMLMYSIGWEGGNIGYRRAQFRGERYMALSDEALLTLQSSLNTSLVAENTTGLVANHPGWPVIEGRMALALGPRGPNCRPIELGVSGHIGEQEYDFRSTTWDPTVDDLVRRTWSFNVDARVPLTERFGVQAEMFTGENLGAFLGGVGQGIDIGTAPLGATRRGIRSSGGWFDVWYDWTCRLHSHAGYGIDDPVDEDVTIAGRTYNQFFFTNLSYDLTKQFLVGAEVSQWKTLWDAPLAPADSTRVEFVVKYNF
jgi:hypothetical protein